MPPPGPPPTPTAAKKLAGNPGRRPLNENEPVPESGAPERPKLRDEVAEKAWEVLCRELDKMRILATSDQIALTLCAETWSLWREMLAALNDEGAVSIGAKGGAYINPVANLESMYAKRLESYATAMGLTATARARVQKIVVETPPDGKGRFFSSGLKVVG